MERQMRQKSNKIELNRVTIIIPGIPLRFCKRSSCGKSANRSANRLVNRSTNRSVYRLANRSVNGLANRSANRLANRSANRPANRLTNRSVNRLAYRSANGRVPYPVGVVSRWGGGRDTGSSVYSPRRECKHFDKAAQ